MFVISSIILGLLVCVAIHTASMAIVGRLVGAKIEVVSLFIGPRIWGVRLGSTDFRLSALPLGGYVKFADDFEQQHPLARIAVAASGNVTLLLTAFVTLGVNVGWAEFTHGFEQFLSGAWAPRTRGVQLLHGFAHRVNTQSWPPTLGLCAAKTAAYNLFPLATLNGGYILLTLIQCLIPLSEKTRERLTAISLLAMLLFMASWAIALISALSR